MTTRVNNQAAANLPPHLYLLSGMETRRAETTMLVRFMTARFDRLKKFANQITLILKYQVYAIFCCKPYWTPSLSNENDTKQTTSKRNWDALSSAEAFDVICQNRLFLKDEQTHILNIAALRLGEIGDFIATNFLQNLSINPHPDDLFLWARIQAVAEGLVFAPDEIGAAMVLPDAERIETYRNQAIFLFRYFAKWFLDIARDNVSGGEAVVADLKERAFLANDVADILLDDLKRSVGQDNEE